MQESQLEAVYDHWVVRGSDIDLDNSSGGSSFALDPDEDDIQFLKSATNLSPTCVEDTTGCFLTFDVNDLASLDFEYFIVQRIGVAQMDTLDTQLAAMGKSILWVDDAYEHGTGCYNQNSFQVANEANCYAASLIDTVRRLEVLATFLGIDSNDKVIREQQAMCTTAADFVSHAQSLENQGILSAAVSLRVQNGGTVSLFSPTSHPHLRTLEELGMSIIHTDEQADFAQGQDFSTGEWFPQCPAGAAIDTCADLTPLHPVDFWLIDSRAYAFITESPEDFEAQIPDPAFVSRQYSYWVWNDGAISYTNIRRFLQEVMEATSGLSRIHAQANACIDVDPTSRAHTSLTGGGLTAGQYVCFDRSGLQELYLECPNVPVPSSNQSGGTTSSVASARYVAHGISVVMALAAALFTSI